MAQGTVKCMALDDERYPETMKIVNEYRRRNHMKSGINALENLVKLGWEAFEALEEGPVKKTRKK